MKSPLRYTTSLDPLKRISRLSVKRKSRKSSSVGTSYQSLERRNLLTAFTVTTLQDSVASDGEVSLREAIVAANTNAVFRDAGAGDIAGDTIGFAPQLAGQTLRVNAGEIEITDDLRIIGNVTLDAQNQSRILTITTSEKVLIAGLTFVRGQTSTGLTNSNGGAIEVIDGNVQISRAEFLDSTARQGGAVHGINSNIQIGRSTFTGNRAGAGGAVYGTDSNIKIFQSTFTDNHATIGAGGAAFFYLGRLSAVESTFSENTSRSSAGAIGANGQLFVSQSTFTGNHAGFRGGGVFSTAYGSLPTIIRSSDFIANTSKYDGAGFYLNRGVTAYVSGTLFEGNAAGTDGGSRGSDRGGGIFSRGRLFVSDSRILSNTALDGGGGVGAEGGSVLLTNSLISGNQAGIFGGGISGEETYISVINTTVTSNRVNNPIVPPGTTTTTETFVGGGLSAKGQEDNSFATYSVFIRNSNFSSNFAGHAGGGVFTEGVRLRVVDSSFTDNLVNTIVAPVLDSGETFSGGGGAIQHRSSNGKGRELFVFGSVFRGNELTFGVEALAFGERLPLLGGGISTIDSDAFLRENYFIANSSEGSGGALAQTGFSTLLLIDADFIGNSAGTNRLLPASGFDNIGSDDSPNGLGGAFYTQNTGAASPFPVRIFGGDFNKNTAFNGGGAIFADSTDPRASLFIRANSAGEGARFISNRAFAEDGGAFAGNGVSMNARDAFFANNSARNGGAIHVEGVAELRLVFSEFRKNMARLSGGAIYFTDNEFVNFKNAFVNNSAINGPDFFEDSTA